MTILSADGVEGYHDTPPAFWPSISVRRGCQFEAPPLRAAAAKNAAAEDDAPYTGVVDILDVNRRARGRIGVGISEKSSNTRTHD